MPFDCLEKYDVNDIVGKLRQLLDLSNKQVQQYFGAFCVVKKLGYSSVIQILHSGFNKLFIHFSLICYHILPYLFLDSPMSSIYQPHLNNTSKYHEFNDP